MYPDRHVHQKDDQVGSIGFRQAGGREHRNYSTWQARKAKAATATSVPYELQRRVTLKSTTLVKTPYRVCRFICIDLYKPPLMSGTTHFLLYRVTIEPSDDDESFENFKEILDHPRDKYQGMMHSVHKYQLDGIIRKTQGIYYGTFCLIQTSELPTKAKFGEEPEDLLGDDEEIGLGHYTSFFFDSTNNMIAVQNNPNGISANGIAAFFRRNYEFRDIIFEHVINPDELAKLNNLTQIRSFEISIAKLENGQAFSKDTDSLSFKEVTKMADSTNANVFRLYLGVGYQKENTLSKGGIRKYINSILGKQAANNITKIEIKGREGDEESLEIIDLINNKIRFTVTLPKARSVNRGYVQKLVTSGITEYQKVLPALHSYKIKAKH